MYVAMNLWHASYSSYMSLKIQIFLTLCTFIATIGALHMTVNNVVANNTQMHTYTITYIHMCACQFMYMHILHFLEKKFLQLHMCLNYNPVVDYLNLKNKIWIFNGKHRVEHINVL